MKKIFLSSTANCWPSTADFDLIKTYFRKNGWTLSKNIDHADFVLVNTCANAIRRENLSIEFIKKALKEKKSQAQLIVTGCLPIINKARLKRIFKGITISANSLQDLDKFFKSKTRVSEIQYVGSTRKSAKNKRLAYPLRIGWGCQGKCTYCAIRFVFGSSRSRPILDILKEYNAAYNKGYRRFALVSNDAGNFGKDLGVSLAYLLKKLCQKNKESRFQLSHISPDRLIEILPSLKAFIRSGRIWNIKIPVQSGNNRILRLMRRNYTVNDFKYCVEKLIDYNPSLEIDTDIIVGFPTETENDFQDTMKLIDYSSRHIFAVQCLRYSNRPNTVASRMSGQIDEKIKKDRWIRLNNLYNFNYQYKKGDFSLEVIKDRHRKTIKTTKSFPRSSIEKNAVSQCIANHKLVV